MSLKLTSCKIARSRHSTEVFNPCSGIWDFFSEICSNASMPCLTCHHVESNNSNDSSSAFSLARTTLSGCGSGNPIDDCWMCDPQWESHRQTLANCAIGFGKNAIGGKNGRIYVVTSNSDDNVENPVPGTLRYAASRNEPLWIIFANSMTIHLNQELFVTSYKTIDGRGATVIITGGASLSMVSVNNVIIHGLYIHNIVSTGPASIITSQSLVEQHGVADGDAIHIQTSNNIWVDHCFLAKAADGLIDCTDYSNLITISNNYFTAHDKV